MGDTLHFKYTRNKHQKEFHEDVTTKLLHLSTGFGGGKTYALCMKTIQLSILNRNTAGGMVAESFAEFKKDWLPLMEEILDANKVNYAYKSNGKYGPHFTFPWTDATIFVQSGEKKIRGPNWGWAVANELTLIPLIRYQEIMGRVRVKGAKFPQIATVGTPEGWANDYYDFLIENPPRDKNGDPIVRVIYGNSTDNAENLAEGYIETMSSSYDSVMQDAYIKGLWVNMAGNRFYYAYDHTKKYRHKKSEWDWFHVGMDFNVDPMAASIWQWDGMRLKGIEEIEIPGREKGADTKQMIQALKSRGYVPQNTIIYPDPSGNNRSTKGNPDIKILQDAGYTEIRVKKRHPGFRQRQLHMNNLLEKSVIQPNDETQPKTCKDLMSVEQNIITLEKDKSNPKLTHFSDGLDYLCDILIPFNPRQEHAHQGRRI